LLTGVVAGFLSLAYIEYYMDIAWPWYCAIGGAISIAVAWIASVLLDGFQEDWSLYSVKGQLKKYKDEGLPEKQDGWYVVSGRIDKASYGLLVFFVGCVALLWILNSMI